MSRVPEPSTDAETVLDVDGDVVSPGFIDTHSNSDLQLFADPTLAPKVRQGIKTEILGQDGLSMAPMYREGGAEEWQDQLAGLAERVDHEWTWGDVGAYLDAVEESGIAPNVGTLVGHGTVRFNVIGMEDAEPTDEQLSEMRDLVAEAIDEGAFGLSTALVITQCSYATTEEETAPAGELSPYGCPFVAHIRSEWGDIWNALNEFVNIGATAGVPVHLSHFKLGGPRAGCRLLGRPVPLHGEQHAAVVRPAAVGPRREARADGRIPS